MTHTGSIVLFMAALAIALVVIGLLPTQPSFWAVLGLAIVIVVVPAVWGRR